MNDNRHSRRLPARIYGWAAYFFFLLFALFSLFKLTPDGNHTVGYVAVSLCFLGLLLLLVESVLLKLIR